MSKEALHPEILEGLDYETQFIQTTASGKNRRIGGFKRGDSWLIRFIPARMGPKKQWYARIAQHWLNKKAVFCPRQTAKEWGGDPEAYCPVCDAAERLNADSHKDVSSFGYRLSSTPQWRTWVVVLEKGESGVDPVPEKMNEVLRPYEYNMYRTVWEELIGFVRKGSRRNPLSVFDYKLGNDFWLTKGAKGMRLDKEDSAPLFDVDDNKLQDYIEKIEAACKDPVVKMHSDKQLEDFTDKALEEAESLGRPARGRASREDGGRGRQRGDEDDLPQDDERPRSRGRGEDDAPRGRAADEETPRGRGREEDDAPRGRTPREEEPVEEPTRSRQNDSEQPRRRTAAAPPREEEPVEEPSRSRGRGRAVEPEPEDNVPMGDTPAEEPLAEEEQAPQEQELAPRGRGREVAEAPRRPSSSSGRASAAAGAPARPSSRGGGNVRESIDDEENVPEEARDQAPARRPLISAEDEAQIVERETEEPPPATPRKGALGASIRDRVQAVTARQK